MVFIQQSITEYVEPGAAQRVLEEMRAYFEAMRTRLIAGAAATAGAARWPRRIIQE